MINWKCKTLCRIFPLQRPIRKWDNSLLPFAMCKRQLNSSRTTLFFMASWACYITRTATMRQASLRLNVPCVDALPNNPALRAATAD